MNTAPATKISAAEMKAAAPARRYSHFQSVVGSESATVVMLTSLEQPSGCQQEPDQQQWNANEGADAREGGRGAGDDQREADNDEDQPGKQGGRPEQIFHGLLSRSAWVSTR